MTAPTMQVRLVSPTATVFQGEAAAMVAPAYDGQVGVLPGHAPYITLLGGGRLHVELPGGGTESFFVNRGVLKVEANEVVVLTEYAGRDAPPEFRTADAWVDPAELQEMSTPGNPLA
jgi:F-type H+-transporting ATPase subunit epsilon